MPRNQARVKSWYEKPHNKSPRYLLLLVKSQLPPAAMTRNSTYGKDKLLFCNP